MSISTLFGGNVHGLVASGSTSGFSLGTQFSVSQSVTLTGIWWYSNPSAVVLPTACALYNATTGTQIPGTLNSAPSWSGAAGSGWVKCTYDGTVVLTSGTNYVSVVFNIGGSTSWYSQVNGYWTSGGGSAGITSGTLTAPNSAGAVNGQAVFIAAVSTIAFPNGTITGFDFGVDVEVSTAPPPTPEYPIPPPMILPHPQFRSMLLGLAWERADWQAQGVADLTVAYVSSAGGVDTYNVTSPWNNPAGSGGGTQQMRVLNPTAAANPNYPHAFAIMLPVDRNQDTTFGDSIGTAQAVNANDTWNLTLIQPGYAGPLGGSVGPWFGDNPLDQTISQEKFTLLVAAWIRKNLATTGREKTYLIGFSRSGLAGQFLLFRHPDLFAAVASWDFPGMMSDYDGTDPFGFVGGSSDVIYGTSASFQRNYRLDTHLAGYAATGQYGSGRIWIGQGPHFADTPAYHAALNTVGIPHTYTFSNTAVSHAWGPEWVSAALASMIPSNYVQATTALPQQVPQHVFRELLDIAAYRLEIASGGTGVADPTQPRPPVAAAAGAALNPAVSAIPVVTVNAGLASAAGTAVNASFAYIPAGLASATAAAQQPGLIGPPSLTALTISPTRLSLTAAGTSGTLNTAGTGPANATIVATGATQRTLTVNPTTGEGGP